MLGRADAATPSSDEVALRVIGHALPHPGGVRSLHSDGTGTLIDGGGDHERERALRREVGPTAWAALADLCLDARVDDGGVLASPPAPGEWP